MTIHAADDIRRVLRGASAADHLQRFPGVRRARETRLLERALERLTRRGQSPDWRYDIPKSPRTFLGRA
jgi:hypothetical protein